jgi:hypothetical protein
MFLCDQLCNLCTYCTSNVCVSLRVTAYLEHMLEAVYGALEGLNKQAFMTELVLLSHPQMTVPFMICDLNLVATFELQSTGC